MFKEIKLTLDNVSRDITATQNIHQSPFLSMLSDHVCLKFLHIRTFTNAVFFWGFFSTPKKETKPHSNVILFACIILSEIY